MPYEVILFLTRTSYPLCPLAFSVKTSYAGLSVDPHALSWLWKGKALVGMIPPDFSGFLQPQGFEVFTTPVTCFMVNTSPQLLFGCL